VREWLTRARIDPAERPVVHRSLTRRRNLVWKRLRETLIKDVYDSLRGLHIATAHGRWRASVYDGSFGSDDLNRPHAAGIRRNRRIDQRAKHVEHDRSRDRIHGVHAAFGLPVRS